MNQTADKNISQRKLEEVNKYSQIWTNPYLRNQWLTATIDFILQFFFVFKKLIFLDRHAARFICQKTWKQFVRVQSLFQYFHSMQDSFQRGSNMILILIISSSNTFSPFCNLYFLHNKILQKNQTNCMFIVLSVCFTKTIKIPINYYISKYYFPLFLCNS